MLKFKMTTHSGMLLLPSPVTVVYKNEFSVPADDVTVDRIAVSAGWYVTKNIMAKAEYVTQNYKGFNASDIRNGGNFEGLAVQAIVGF